MNGINDILEKLGISSVNHGVSTGQAGWEGAGALLESFSPVDGLKIGAVTQSARTDYDRVVETASLAFKKWRSVPAPRRGEIVRQIGDKLRSHKQELGTLVSYEMGKSLQEGLGEVQEMIDICDFATGLSRQLYGLTMHSERPQHRMYEQWHPLGVVGIITAFNFPVAVWSWNAMIAWVCGNVCVWKPSEKTPLTAVACQNIIHDVLKANDVPEGVSCIVSGGRDVGKWIAGDVRISLVSATGSIPMGRAVGEAVAQRLGKSLLELGGNNAVIVTPTADLKVAIPGIVFGAVGTAGQRCTSTRRLIVHESIFDEVKNRLVKAYSQLKIGNPLDAANHVGPLIDRLAVTHYQNAVEQIRQSGGTFIVEPRLCEGAEYVSGCYVAPCVAEVENHYAIVQHETFAPILYMIRYRDLNEAIALQNDVPQGLSSSIFTNDLRNAEQFLSFAGSDCGIANVNIGTSGAEIGGAFGGEKETGGGRESGSDAWKAYMRRQTNTINYGTALPLAQGIKFEIE
ncbi:aldehyde dehydrogenase family protein [Dyadobacter sp. CY261]|uniref:L-piperidine-6-carboxylate dehydrogenase n=1 Tax=Dyadobacter sp. CY261 TaxID=2907203 RepID=UPI001F1DADCA|nr:aldehyde dehydrogenase family protein [Dyadobacter sp. CY261]MCF0073171.1 aldehyde dehydrogenase family protein [Dyadobacter sp. CY261]